MAAASRPTKAGRGHVAPLLCQWPLWPRTHAPPPPPCSLPPCACSRALERARPSARVLVTSHLSAPARARPPFSAYCGSRSRTPRTKLPSFIMMAACCERYSDDAPEQFFLKILYKFMDFRRDCASWRSIKLSAFTTCVHGACPSRQYASFTRREAGPAVCISSYLVYRGLLGTSPGGRPATAGLKSRLRLIFYRCFARNI